MYGKFDRILSADFETTVYDGQERTDVWAAAFVELFTENACVYSSIDAFFNVIEGLPGNTLLYFHNLKFDGAFIVDYYLSKRKFELAGADVSTDDEFLFEWCKPWEMKNKTIQCTISNKGMWYIIRIKIRGHVIEIHDSLKLLPFSVESIGKSFGTKHRKSSIVYTGFRKPGRYISDVEKQYIINDVMVVKEALEIMYRQGHNRLTIGSCCMDEFRKMYDNTDYQMFFPDVYQIDSTIAGLSAGKYILKSYYGGWCYLKSPGHKYNGVTLDVNSLYSSVMHSKSGSRYPVGKPNFWIGEIPEDALKQHRYYFIRFRCRFKLKNGKLPWVHIRNDVHYKSNESLITSDWRDRSGIYHQFYYDENNNLVECRPEMTMTCTDWILFNEHYHIYDLEIIDGCWFFTEIGLFDEYINKYMNIKMKSKGALRTEAKLFLNNLYGKMATSTDSSFKIPYLGDDNVVHFKTCFGDDKRPGYIPIGSAITSYARNFTIRAAQKNYKYFCYADTDSIHCECNVDKIVGVEIHDTNLCCWKAESYWDEAMFTRQKTYIEHVTHENGVKIDNPYYNVKAAGMGKKCQSLIARALDGNIQTDIPEEQEFFKRFKTLGDFKIGLEVPGDLSPKRIPGGIVLEEKNYVMR